MSAASTEGAWQDAGPADLDPGKLRAVRVGERDVCVGRGADGFFAVDDLCPHAGGSLAEGMVDGDELICPLHGYGFDVKSGECPDDPSCRLRVHELRVREGVLQVKR